DVTDLSSAFSTCLASPFVSDRNDGPSLITCPSGADRQPHDRWETLTTRGARTDRREDGWRALICRRADESYSGIRTAQNRRGALRLPRVFIHVYDSCDTPRLAHGTTGPVDDRQSDRPAWCHDGQAILVCPAPSHFATGREDVTA